MVEIVISLAIVVMVLGSVIAAYIGSCFRAQWSGYNLAAQSLAMQQLELARTAKWDVMANVDQLINPGLNLSGWASANGVWSGYTTNTLDLPVSGGGVVLATNYCFVSLVSVSTTPPSYVHMVEVQTVWPFMWYNKTYLYTNTVVDYIAPDY